MAAAATEPPTTRPAPLAPAATWAAVVLVAASVPLHLLMLLGHSHGVVLSAAMAAMALWCLWCAAGVARAPTCPSGRSLRHLWTMAVVMAFLHVALLTGFPFALGGHDHGGAGPTSGVTSGAGPMLAVVVLELAICFACALALRARHTHTHARRRPPAGIVPPHHLRGAAGGDGSTHLHGGPGPAVG